VDASGLGSRGRNGSLGASLSRKTLQIEAHSGVCLRKRADMAATNGPGRPGPTRRPGPRFGSAGLDPQGPGANVPRGRGQDAAQAHGASLHGQAHHAPWARNRSPADRAQGSRTATSAPPSHLRGGRTLGTMGVTPHRRSPGREAGAGASPLPGIEPGGCMEPIGVANPPPPAEDLHGSLAAIRPDLGLATGNGRKTRGHHTPPAHGTFGSRPGPRLLATEAAEAPTARLARRTGVRPTVVEGNARRRLPAEPPPPARGREGRGRPLPSGRQLGLHPETGAGAMAQAKATRERRWDATIRDGAPQGAPGHRLERSGRGLP
jgi:hypothetical protein